jgi:CelD/BcsL family acetyltransferase involved in cellulose biosynthesis
MDLRNPLSLLKTGPEAESCHEAALLGTWDSLGAKLLKHNQLRRKLRSLEREGTVTFEIASTPEQYDAYVEVLLRQKSQRDIEERGYDSLMRPGYVAYLKQARCLLYPSGPVCLFVLKVGDSIVASYFGVTDGRRFIAQTPGIEGGRWVPYSVGKVLICKMFEWCFSRGIHAFDLGYGDERYKNEYCDVENTLHKAVIPVTWKGCLASRWRTVSQGMHRRRVSSWREMEIAEAACCEEVAISPSLAHARRSLVLWPSPRRAGQFLSVASRIGARHFRAQR